MLSDWKFWVLTLVGFVALVYTGLNYQLRGAVVAKQQEVLQRQQFINESSQLSKFNSQFIRALASVAAQTDDSTITQLLADHGVTYSVNENASQEAGNE